MIIFLFWFTLGGLLKTCLWLVENWELLSDLLLVEARKIDLLDVTHV